MSYSAHKYQYYIQYKLNHLLTNFCYNLFHYQNLEEKHMTTENLPPLTEKKRFIMHPYIAGIIAVIVVALLGTGYFYWYVPSVNEALKESKQTLQPATAAPVPTTATFARTTPQPVELAAVATPPQEIPVPAMPVQLAGVLHNVNKQIAVIQLLLANQQFPAALNLLDALESDALLLPAVMQGAFHTAIEADRENIQQMQAVIGQLEGQLQQVEHYLNQQLLERLAQQGANAEVTHSTPATEPTPLDTTWKTAVWNKIKELLSQGVEVQYKSKNQTISEPNFYTAIMLQMALQRAQFALEQGNWPEYQLTLTSLQTWVTPNLLTWLPDAPGMIKTITELAEQSSPFANANVNATQQALNNLLQESNS